MPEQDDLAQELLGMVGDPAGRGYIQTHLLRFLKTIELIPAGRPLAVLDLGTFLPLAAVLRRRTPHTYTWHGLWPGPEACKEVAFNGAVYLLYNFNVETQSFPFPPATFDLVLCSEVLEHLGLDPLFMLAEINRVLKPDGRLLLTTPNVTSARNVGKILLGCSPQLYSSFCLQHDRHNREYSPGEVDALFAAAGFKTDKLLTRNVYFPSGRLFVEGWRSRIVVGLLLRVLGISALRGDAIFALGRRTGPVVDRYPSQFYDLP